MQAGGTQQQPPSQERELLGLATACARRGDFATAMIHLKELLAVDPRQEIALGMLAGIYAELKMPDRAVALYRQVLTVNPGNPLARFQLGLLQLAESRPGDALETLRPVLGDENDFLAHFHSGLALRQLGRAGEARQLLEVAARRMPPDHLLYPQLRGLLGEPAP